MQRDRIKFVHFGLYLDINIKVVKPTLYRKVLPSKKAAKLYCAFVWLVSILLAILFLRGWVGMQKVYIELRVVQFWSEIM